MDKRDTADRLLDEAIADLRSAAGDETLSPSCRASIVEEALRAEAPATSGVRLIARWALVFGAVPVAAAAFLLIALAPDAGRHVPELVSAEKQGESVVFTIADGSGGSCQLGTIHSRCEIRIGANWSRLARTQSCSATWRARYGGGTMPARAQAATTSAAASVPSATSAVTRLRRQVSGALLPGSANAGRSATEPASASAKSTLAAPASSSAAETASTSGAASSKETASQAMGGERRKKRG